MESDFSITKILEDYAADIKAAMPKSVAELIEVEIRSNGAGVLAPFWLPVLEKGRAPRKNNTDSKLYHKIYEWMDKRHMFKSRTSIGKINEAKSLTWFINKYGTKMYRDGKIKDVYTKKTKEVISKIEKEYSDYIGKVTSELL